MTSSSSVVASWAHPSPITSNSIAISPAALSSSSAIPTYARASSALSASSIRQQFSTPLNIHLSRYGIGFLRRAPELLGVDLGLKEPGYLFLASDAGEAVLRANHAIQKGEGCAVELLEPGGVARPLSLDLDRRRGAGLAGHRQRGLVRRPRADAGLPPQGARAGRPIRRRRGRRTVRPTPSLCAPVAASRRARSCWRRGRGPARSPHWPASRCRSSRAAARCSSSMCASRPA